MSHQGCRAVPWGLGSPRSGELCPQQRRAGRWWLQNVGVYVLCVWEGVTAARHVLGIIGVFGVRA